MCEPVRVDQDSVDYMGEVTMEVLSSNAIETLKSQSARQEAWLKRGRSDAVDSSRSTWKPKKRHRNSAFAWLCCIHNQLNVYFQKGLLYFMADPSSPAIDWNRLSVSPDMGSDGVIASVIQWVMNIV